MDQLTFTRRLLRGICDVAITLSVLTTHFVAVTAASSGPSLSICSVLSLLGGFMAVTAHPATCIVVCAFLPVYICNCPLLSPSLVLSVSLYLLMPPLCVSRILFHLFVSLFEGFTQTGSFSVIPSLLINILYSSLRFACLHFFFFCQ